MYRRLGATRLAHGLPIPASESPTGKPIVLFASEPFAELEVLADVDIGNVTGLSKISSAEVDILK